MSFGKLLLCAGALLGLAACSDDKGVTDNPDPAPAASVRFLNAVPDMGTVDLRFPDKVESLPTMQGVAYQATSGFYQRVAPGVRVARIFPNSSNVDTAQIRLVDTTVTLNADTRYTLVYAGRAAGNKDVLGVFTESRTPAAPPAGQIALKVLNAAVDLGNVDVYVTPAPAGSNNADPINNAVTVIRNVPYLGMSAYVNVPVRPLATTTPPSPASLETLYQFTVTAAGSTTPLFTARPNQPGVPAPAGVTYGAQPGVGIEGSILTVALTAAAPVNLPRVPTARTATVTLMADKVFNP